MARSGPGRASMLSPGLELLEVARFQGILADLTTSYLGRERIEAMTPFPTRDEAANTLRIVDRIAGLARAGSGLPPVEVPDLEPVFRRLRREGSILAPAEFLDLDRLLKAVSRLHPVLAGSGDPDLVALAGPLRPAPHLERAVETTFDPAGAVRDGASPGLRRIRRERERLRETLRTRLEKLAATIASGDADSVVTLREGRYVLSVPQGHRGKVKGLVQDRSASGQTLYVEPLVLVEDNNALREKDAEEREEIQRILTELTGAFARERETLEGGWRHTGVLDALRARVELMRRWGGEPPELVEDLTLRLTGARHPLLLEARGAGVDLKKAEAEVIPLSLDLDATRRILLVTGPNMGGKTVALKCVGLMSLMAQCGCPVPADPGCRLPWVENWVVDVGDEQSLEQDLSTFGAHLRRWGAALAGAGPKTLVLLDELGSGTDPTEGAALAQSVLERLAEAGGLGVVTTHLGSLKGFAAEAEGVENASMVFDPESRKPTYRLLIGVPGESHALDMARTLGFPEERVRRAEDLVPTAERDVKKLLADLEHERRVLRETRASLDAERSAAAADREEAAGRLRRILDERARLRAQAARRAREILRRAEEQAKQLQRQGRAGERTARKELAREQARLARLETASPPARTGKVPDRVRRGERYWAEGLGRSVEVLRGPDDQGRVQVGYGGIRVELPVASLRVSEGGPAPEERPTAPAPVAGSPDVDAVSPEVDLRGLRADEALARLDQAVDRGLLAGIKELRVIHGKGTGALQKVVEEYGRRQPAVKQFRVGERWEGGSGATVLVLED